jgi:hypothetical protein
MANFYYRAARKGAQFEARDVEPMRSMSAAAAWSLQASLSELRFSKHEFRGSKPTLILRVDPPHLPHFRHTPLATYGSRASMQPSKGGA